MTQTSDSILSVTGLTKTFGNFTAVDHISFDIPKGCLLGFLGENGAGKSTVINMLTTLIRPTSGEVTICGNSLGKNDSDIRKKIGIVPQQNCLDDLLSVKENLLTRGILYTSSNREAKERLAELIPVLKLEDILNRKYKHLSGGQKRRAEIAAALIHRPEILFLDEPTTGLDPATRLDVWSTIEDLRKDRNMTVFLTTHYMEEAATADRIIILDHGHVLADDTPFNLKKRYVKDRLKLYTDDPDRLLNSDTLKNVPNITRTGYGLEIALANTDIAYLLLSSLKQSGEPLSGFEVILGNMDDVFLTVTQSTQCL